MRKPPKLRVPCRFALHEDVFVEALGYGKFVRQVQKPVGIYAEVRIVGHHHNACVRIGEVLKLDMDDRPINLPKGAVRV